jgi:hypothetical protein
MANNVTHPTAVRNGIADYVTGLLDSGTAGKLVFLTSGAATVATLTFTAPGSGGAFGTATGGICTANVITDDSNAAGGTMTNAAMRDSAGTTIIACTVGTSGCDINMSGVAVGAGDTVRVTSLTYTACP